jgi:hypothetical protein
MLLPKAFLQGMQLPILRHTFDGFHAFAIGLDGKDGAAFDGPAV